MEIEPDIEDFKKYLEEFNKSYPEDLIFYKRLKAFKESLANIRILNQNTTNVTAKYGLTKFSDLLPEEFVVLHLNKPRPKPLYSKHFKHTQSFENIYPKKVDWRTSQKVSKVKDQKSCGACWAFAVTETIESMVAIKHDSTLKELSVQEMIDCSHYNFGCDGGDVCSLLQWISDYNVTLVFETGYPLVNKEQKCKKNDTLKGVQIQDFYCFTLIGNEDWILKHLATKGPVSVGINAQNWQYYVGGIIKFHCDDNPNKLNHAVQIVGYDLTGDIPYYIIRNSWGEDFGDNGYLYVAVGNNVCGLAHEVATLSVV